ncbi:ATP-binding protein [Aestuariispira ectoiniformans]|uniref:ATP-binding protein n=1 Tax=Aestuariispira ectoiniformans TaxID=2775080 RepID=UPI00223B9CBD|nr:HAMP domain-containing sensor histidine kinase [Aestuariispira ectoiniformans]
MNRLGVSFKIGVGIGLIVAITLIAGITALLTLQSLQSGYRTIAETNIPRLVESGKMLGTVRTLEAKGVEMAAAPSSIDVTRIYHQAQDFAGILISGLDQMDSLQAQSAQRADNVDKSFPNIRKQLESLDANLKRLRAVVEARIEAQTAFHLSFQEMLDRQRKDQGLSALWHLRHAVDHSAPGQAWVNLQHDILSAFSGLHLVNSLPRLRGVERRIEDAQTKADQLYATLDDNEKAEFASFRSSIAREVTSPHNPLQRRRRLLQLTSNQAGLLSANRQITTILVAEVTDVFAGEHQQVLSENDAFKKLATSRAGLMVLLSVASLIFAFIIVGYLHQSVLRRLNALKERMLGSLHETTGKGGDAIVAKGDEIAEIGSVLDHFYDEIKLRENRLRHARDDAEQLAVRAEAANRAKSTFLANMSHELRTPLNAIIGFSDIIKSGMKKGSEAEYANDIHQSGTHLLNLINGILELSKIEAGKHELDHEPVDVSAITEQVQRFFTLPIREKDLAISSRFEGDCVIRADEMAVKQILVNLISNAVKFTGSTGRIQVVGQREEPYYRIRVIDTGIGIDKSELDKVVEPFHQGKERYDDAIPGTGLGLAIVRNLVELHGGRLTLESNKGEGTTVTVLLPVDVDAPPLTAEPSL